MTGNITRGVAGKLSGGFFSVPGLLVLQQGRFDGYRAYQSVQDKAQTAGNGGSIGKGCNAVLNALASSLRASRKAIIRGVASFEKGITLSCKMRLAANCFPTRCIHQTYLVGVLDAQHGYSAIIAADLLLCLRGIYFRTR